MTECDCGATPFGNHVPDCALVKLRKRPRIDCAGPCQRDDAPQATAEEFQRIDYCADCEESNDGAERDATRDLLQLQDEEDEAWRKASDRKGYVESPSPSPPPSIGDS